MKKARLINLGICFSLVLNLFSVVNFTTPVYAEEDDDTEEKADAVEEHQPTAKDKIQEMIDRLNNQEFTRFWP